MKQLSLIDSLIDINLCIELNNQTAILLSLNLLQTVQCTYVCARVLTSAGPCVSAMADLAAGRLFRLQLFVFLASGVCLLGSCRVCVIQAIK